MTKIHLLAAAAVLTTLTLGAAVQAQPAPPPAPMRAERPVTSPAERLRTLLQLRPQQEGALQTYVAAVKPDREKMRAKMAERRAEPRPTSTPDRIARRQQMLSERQAQMASHDRATLAFYGQLDAKQKAVFDTLGQRHGRKFAVRDGRDGHGFGPQGPHRRGPRGPMGAPPEGPMAPPPAG
ncbi:Spy/CpxP family protein refolding chaperone [Phenylobacterium immobile]|uniref:Spy/CpxP family protein refolding chaperone n=1 Tax=Phenylobacterium immobile TaxID=21 RepID=UPI000B175C3B|nr:Spy/CpxP family protein refolding chaperone [Phenylobacterium immobile]